MPGVRHRDVQDRQDVKQFFPFILIYLLIINLIAAAVFATDKLLARRSERRVPEAVLHLLEAAGGVFAIAALIFILRHKNRKAGYVLVSLVILAAWTSLLWYYSK
jgi:uncharacterized membrane protein YsdA (DUF1294 family)